MLAYLLISPAMLLIARGYADATRGALAVGASQLLGICTAMFFFWSADAYGKTGLVRPGRLKFGAPLVVWFLVAPMLLGTPAVLAPGYLVAAVFMAAAGVLFGAIAVERRLVGAWLVAIVFLGMAVAHVTAAFTVPRVLSTTDFLFDVLIAKSILLVFGALGMHLLVFEDMTYELRTANRELEAARQELTQAAITDPLTGCHNRRFLEQVIQRELQRHSRFKLPLSLLFIDIDHFKAVNDRLGHVAGDRVLQNVAAFLTSQIRDADYVFRYGGDEFLVLITCRGGEARQKGERLKAAFERARDGVRLPPGIGLSVGTIEVPAGTTDLAPLIREADRRMYEDKQAHA
jgi:diguanylate cyclase (GGDEF)-like protein